MYSSGNLFDFSYSNAFSHISTRSLTSFSLSIAGKLNVPSVATDMIREGGLWGKGVIILYYYWDFFVKFPEPVFDI